MLKRKGSLLVSLLIILSLVFVSAALALDYKYVGSKNSDKYHYPSCKWAMKIKPENLVTFKSVKEAKEKGYVACKVCKPPEKD